MIGRAVKWMRLHWRGYQRRREADRRGWGSLGLMMGNGGRWSAARFGRELRRSNRLYRLAHGKTPWRPFNGY